MLKHVTPAHPEAQIPDPTRGTMLPPAGRPVVWSAHWAGMEKRGDVTVSDVVKPAEADAATVPDADAATVPEADA